MNSINDRLSGRSASTSGCVSACSCVVRGCTDEATATVLVGATRLPYCFWHEREYVDRFGPSEVYALA